MRFAWVLLIGVGATAASAWEARPDHPNVVVLLADDSGWGDLGIHGNTNVTTPNLDALARAGATFDAFFVCPVCSPTRAEFLTGRYHPRGGVRGVSTGQERLDLDERTIAEVFQRAGYATGAFGKWHNGTQWPYHPLARGFDAYYGFTSGHWGEYFDPPLDDNGAFVRGKGFVSDDFADHAMEFIERNRTKPFFCYVPFNVPHSPYCVPAEYWDRYRNKPISMRGADGPRESIEETRAVLAMVENMDWNVGRILNKINELDLAENTIVVYFSDNGPNTVRWNGGMKGRKGTTDEGGVRSPLLIRWPGRIEAGTRVEAISGAIDLLPTLAALCGIAPFPDRPLDGLDTSPLLFGKQRAWPSDRMIFSHWAGRVSCRTQRYRLDDRGRLFDLQSDPGQKTDVAEGRRETAERLRDAVAAWRADVLGEGSGPARDDRPYPVGYAEFPVTALPARDGVPHGGVRRSAAAPNCSYFVNWTTADDKITWEIEVKSAGAYDVDLYYTCPDADAGSTVELSVRDARLVGRVAPGWDPPLIADQDVIPRPPVESTMKEFRPLRLGTVRLESGRGVCALRAIEVPGRQVMDLRMVVLTLRADGR
ncbi:MAG: arylsulfatase [Planctomycetes bacterium]|nr:arylsulfatase [Planctomycetota bacterium]